jgi:hypothetical protein
LMNSEANLKTGSIIQTKVEPVIINTPILQKPKILKVDFTSIIVKFKPEKKDWKQREEEFRNNAGFSGSFSRYAVPQDSKSNVRYRTFISGKFPLPEPEDSITFRANADFMKNKILELFGNREHMPILSETSIGKNLVDYNPEEYAWQTRYYQLLDGKKIVDMGFGAYTSNSLFISYRIDKSEYSIISELFEYPIEIPVNLISREEAIRIARKELMARTKKSLQEANETSMQAELKFSAICPMDIYDRYNLVCYWKILVDLPERVYYKIDAVSGKVSPIIEGADFIY